ncbi:RNA-binding protein nova-2 [Phtheirospermum japonicum]|uniref:RNA-binding protein nova-2 n=1 Tax=Phtheirospermum japonicum TaxID=374723 RepID=A0A830BH26_9LAMI|nr:RNA-binding protein nova-2 [Phtheirospermum japonicum]
MQTFLLGKGIRYNEEKATYLRFLLSNAEAGSVIGKGGSTISDIQSQSGARIQLSRNFEYFPGTSDRVILVSGRVDDILKAVDLILSKLLDEFYVHDGDETVPESKIRLVVPNSSCGGLIGKGGSIISGVSDGSLRLPEEAGNGKHRLDPLEQSQATPLASAGCVPSEQLSRFESLVMASSRLVSKRGGNLGEIFLGPSHPPNRVNAIKIRTLIEDSRASIKISSQDNYYPGLHDRLVTVTGALVDQMRAVELILLKLIEDQYYHQSANVTFPYAVFCIIEDLP